MTPCYDAILVVSFGGPEGPEDVVPFLQNVLRGRDIPTARFNEVAQHYLRFGGVSPLNAQNRALIAALSAELQRHGPSLPVYWGNRNWHPLLPDTVRQMARDGIRSALAFCTSAFSSYSGCRQYLENIADACRQVGATAPRIDKLRCFYNHPGFIEPWVDRLRTAVGKIPADRRQGVQCIFTAHSLPLVMAQGCDYERQLREACALVAGGAELTAWRLAYQSRSGPPSQPWLEPEVGDALRELAAGGARDVILAPLGFLSDHMEIVYDLDVEACELANELGINLVRAETVGAHPRFIQMIRELILERLDPSAPRRVVGPSPCCPDECPVDCCPAGRSAR
jgi:ferrochelatase